MQEGMHVGPNTQTHALAHREGLPPIHARGFGEGQVYSDRQLWAELERRTIRSEIRDLLLDSGDRPYVPNVRLVLQFLQANRQGSDGGAVIDGVTRKHVP